MLAIIIFTEINYYAGGDGDHVRTVAAQCLHRPRHLRPSNPGHCQQEQSLSTCSHLDLNKYGVTGHTARPHH